MRPPPPPPPPPRSDNTRPQFQSQSQIHRFHQQAAERVKTEDADIDWVEVG
jgi:hypothetical protein